MAILSSMHTHPFLMCMSSQKVWKYGEICLHLSSISVRMQSLISLRIASLVIRLAIRVLEKILDSAKLKASVYRSSVEGNVTVVVSVLGVEGVACTAGAVGGPASSANLTLRVLTALLALGFRRQSWTSWVRFEICLLFFENYSNYWATDL